MSNLLITQDTSTILLICISLLGGIIASISPCSLSILPLIIAYVGGYSKSTPQKTLIEMLFFILGSSIVFGIIGIICALTGKVFSTFAPAYFNLIIASIILTMGLNMLNIIEINIPTFVKEIPQIQKGNIFIYPFLLGCIFSIAGTPCSTPILASIMAFASGTKNIYLSSKINNVILLHALPRIRWDAGIRFP